ncbi:MAG: glycosyltransferase family 4 protein, partial [Candidatus Bathyarchaeia archaeon]
MKICMITWEFPPRIVGGIARHCAGLSRALAKEGHEVHVFTLDFPGTPMFEDVEGVKVHRVRTELGHPNFLTWTFLFNHFIEKQVAMLSHHVDFDIIHIHDWLTAQVGISTKHFLDKPLVSTVHSTEVGRAQELHNPDSYTIDGMEWWMTYESKRIIVCSDSMKWEIHNH